MDKLIAQQGGRLGRKIDVSRQALLDPFTRIIYRVGDGPETECYWHEFVDANGDADLDYIADKISRGGIAAIGGGASPVVTIFSVDQ